MNTWDSAGALQCEMPMNCRICTVKVNMKEAAVSSQTQWCVSMFISCLPCLRAWLRHCYITCRAPSWTCQSLWKSTCRLVGGRGTVPHWVRNSSFKHKVSGPFKHTLFLNSGLVVTRWMHTRARNKMYYISKKNVDQHNIEVCVF